MAPISTPVMSTSRRLIEKVADENGWTLIQRGTYVDTYERELSFPGTRMQKLADYSGWKLREKVVVEFSSNGALVFGWHGTPSTQAALDGTFVGGEYLAAPKRKTTLAALRGSYTPPC